EEAIHIQQTAWLSVEPQLGPAPHLEQLLQGTNPAWQRDEPVGQLRHQSLPLVHGADHSELGQSAMRDLPVNEGLRHDANNLAPGGERRVRQGTHETHSAAAVHDTDVSLGELVGQLHRKSSVARLSARAGATEDAKLTHPSSFCLHRVDLSHDPPTSLDPQE